MPLRGEPFSRPEDIVSVVREMAVLRGVDENELTETLGENFLRVFTGSC
jgi:Tat protein secretion system quality control protein TatD with DNase activity